MLHLIEAGITVHCLRDLTRGGRASTLVEITETAGFAIALENRDEQAIPVGAEVTAACELPGLDPLHVANEGRFVALWPPRTPTGPWHCCDGIWWRNAAAVIRTEAH